MKTDAAQEEFPLFENIREFIAREKAAGDTSEALELLGALAHAVENSQLFFLRRVEQRMSEVMEMQALKRECDNMRRQLNGKGPS